MDLAWLSPRNDSGFNSRGFPVLNPGLGATPVSWSKILGVFAVLPCCLRHTESDSLRNAFQNHFYWGAFPFESAPLGSVGWKF